MVAMPLLKRIFQRTIFESQKHFLQRRFAQHSSEALGCYSDKDPAPSFFNQDVQKILRKLTGLNIEKVYSDVPPAGIKKTVEYQFVTESQLEQIENQNIKNAESFLQMPPVVQMTSHEPTIIGDDPEIEGETENKVIFTDISLGVSDKERLIVVREPNGILRHADWEERTRMNAIYNPEPRKYFKPPNIFDPEVMQVSLNRKDYKFILDFACVQFEPEDALYHRTTQIVYDKAAENKDYELLVSTRHYGPFCFYLAWNHRINDLLVHYLQQNSVDEAAQIVLLYAKIHNIKDLLGEEVTSKGSLEYVKMYGKSHGNADSTVNNAILKLEEQFRQQSSNAAV